VGERASLEKRHGMIALECTSKSDCSSITDGVSPKAAVRGHLAKKIHEHVHAVVFGEPCNEGGNMAVVQVARSQTDILEAQKSKLRKRALGQRTRDEERKKRRFTQPERANEHGGLEAELQRLQGVGIDHLVAPAGPSRGTGEGHRTHLRLVRVGSFTCS
jgi:hypothetical protein